MTTQIHSNDFLPIRKRALRDFLKAHIPYARLLEYEIYQSAVCHRKSSLNEMIINNQSSDNHNKPKQNKNKKKHVVLSPQTHQQSLKRMYDTTNNAGNNSLLYYPMNQYHYGFRSTYRHLIHNVLVLSESGGIIDTITPESIPLFVSRLFWNLSTAFYSAKLDADQRELLIRESDDNARKPNCFLYACPRCHRKESRIHTLQTASADESETIFARCVHCDLAWKCK
jgi:DNA-directed RNA polymerase subunit M/transcription elongation factor TFIIS